MTPFAWASLGVLGMYLTAFFAGTALASRAAKRPVWLFATASGAAALAGIRFCLALGLAFFGPLSVTAAPGIAALDPF